MTQLGDDDCLNVTTDMMIEGGYWKTFFFFFFKKLIIIRSRIRISYVM